MSESGTLTDLPRAGVGESALRPSWLFTAVNVRTVAAAVGLALAAALALRFWHINHFGYNSDEAVYSGQGASIAGVQELQHFFPIFRAHPLLFQTILSIPFALGGGDVWGRLLAGAFGLATIFLTYKSAFLLYGRRAGVIAAVLMALMPYHVVVSRQVLLDGPEAMFATLTLYLLARYAITKNTSWLYAAGAGLGLTFLSKEVGIIFVGSVYAFLALCPSIRVKARELAISAGVMAIVIAPYPLSLLFAGKTHTGSQFLSYQLFRRPNHSLLFYPTSVGEAIGPAVLLAAAAGLWLLRRQRSWREILLLTWIAVPAIFFELYPVKGFQYLLPIAPPIAILAARALALGPEHLPRFRFGREQARAVGVLATVVVALTLAIPSWGRVQPPSSGKFLAGSGGIAGGREAGTWIAKNIPTGSEMLAIGPSMANILQFYGHRKVYGLSVSPNPLRRNPVYEPVENPDLRIRQNDLQYLVWDSYSASRSSFFGNKILRYADRYNGRVVHTETIKVTTADGSRVDKPAIVVYAVRP
jgi:4-amino-4-deoxy-L-arabinose transferase-like glycosyltransferase